MSGIRFTLKRGGKENEGKRNNDHDVLTCNINDNLRRPAQLMWERDCGSVPVLDNSRVSGMITDRDICMAAYFQRKALDQIPVSNAMSQELYACRPEHDLAFAEDLMRSKQVRRLPVISEDGALIGIVSLNDIARRAAAEEQKVGKKEVSFAEVATTLASVCQPRPVEVHS